jgi:hypothetical protein
VGSYRRSARDCQLFRKAVLRIVSDQSSFTLHAHSARALTPDWPQVGPSASTQAGYKSLCSSPVPSRVPLDVQWVLEADMKFILALYERRGGGGARLPLPRLLLVSGFRRLLVPQPDGGWCTCDLFKLKPSCVCTLLMKRARYISRAHVAVVAWKQFIIVETTINFIVVLPAVLRGWTVSALDGCTALGFAGAAASAKCPMQRALAHSGRERKVRQPGMVGGNLRGPSP